MVAFPVIARPRQALRASGIVGAAGAAEWARAEAERIDWEGLFASTGLFGIEIGAAGALAGRPVELIGFMSPPMMAEADYFVLSRSPLPNCPFCVPAASWPDDIVVVHLLTPGVDIDHPNRAVAVRGILDLGECDSPAPGPSSHARLMSALWRPLAGDDRFTCEPVTAGLRVGGQAPR